MKPICGPCAKKNNVCEFASSGRPSINEPVSDRSITEAVPELTTQQTTSGVENDDHTSSTAHANHALFESHEATIPAWASYEASGNAPPAQLDPLAASPLASGQSPVALQNSSLLSPNNAAFAAVRWFGLLANDAARDGAQVSIPNSWANQSLSLDHSGSDGLTQPSALQSATQVLDSPSASYASHDPAHVDTSGGTRREEQIWQSREAIELLPTEATLFEHFLNQVSPWVCHGCHSCDLAVFV